MALLGPGGLEELGETILSKTYHAIRKLSEIEGIRVPFFEACQFKEFTVNFDQTSKSVQEVNRELLQYGILGGKSLDLDFPELGQTSLYCVTEIHTSEEIEKTQNSMKKILED